MKILFFCRYFYPHIGGVEKHVMEISKLLIRQGHSVTVVSEKSSSLEKKHEVHKKIRIYRIPVGKDDWFKKWKIWFWLLKHENIIEDADVVHCHDVFFWYLPFRFLCPFKKVFTTFHGYEGDSLPTKRAIFIHSLAEILSRGNICVGHYLEKWYGTKPTMITYGGIGPVKKNDLSLNVNFKDILFIGRLEKETGILEYLKAFELLTKNNRSMQLTILGDGSLREESESYVARLNLRVKFLGFVPNVDRFIQKASVIFTSRYLSTLESFAHKKFVFAIYNNAIKKDCFLLSPFSKYIILVKDERKLAEVFIKIKNDKKMVKKRIQKSHDWVKSQTWQYLAKRYLVLWQ